MPPQYRSSRCTAADWSSRSPYVPFARNRWIGTPQLAAAARWEGGERLSELRAPTSHHCREHLHRHRLEDAGERLRSPERRRTCASCQVVLWWVRSNNTPGHPQRLTAHAPTVPPPPDADYATNKTRARRSRTDPGPVTAADHVPAHPPPGASGRARGGRDDRVVDALWRRTSYSALTASAHEAAYRGRGPPFWRAGRRAALRRWTRTTPRAPSASRMADLRVGVDVRAHRPRGVRVVRQLSCRPPRGPCGGVRAMRGRPLAPRPRCRPGAADPASATADGRSLVNSRPGTDYPNWTSSSRWPVVTLPGAGSRRVEQMSASAIRPRGASPPASGNSKSSSDNRSPGAI